MENKMSLYTMTQLHKTTFSLWEKSGMSCSFDFFYYFIFFTQEGFGVIAVLYAA
jgi:hypothetical protein